MSTDIENTDFELFDFINVESNVKFNSTDYITNAKEDCNNSNEISIHLLDNNEELRLINDEFYNFNDSIEIDNTHIINQIDSSLSNSDELVLFKELNDYSKIKVFPKRLVNAINSADITEIKYLLSSSIKSTCLYSVYLPNKITNLTGFDKLVNSFSNMFNAFPDLICMLQSVVSIDSNGQSILDCKIRCTATITKRTIESFDTTDNIRTFTDLIHSYNPEKDSAKRRENTLNAMNKLNNDGTYVKAYVKLRIKYYIDEVTNTIAKLVEIPRLSSCELSSC